jgi:hypothetical protein
MTSSPHIHGRNGTNIEEALALHERSCQIFGAASRPTTSNGVSTIVAERPKLLHRRVTAVDAPFQRDVIAPAGPIRAQSATEGLSGQDVPEDICHYENYVPATVMHWTSTETRRQEYNRIDKSNKGLRGLLKKYFPKLAAKPSDSRFYDEKEGSTAGSVRRFRLDLPDEEEAEGKRNH